MTDLAPSGSAAILCDPFLDALPISSASVSVFDGRRQSTVCVSDEVAARLDGLQLELGVGPQWDALALARPVLTPCLEDEGNAEWAAFIAGALHLGVHAYFAFPMLVGAAAVGVVGLASRRPGPLNDAQLATAVALTGATATPAMARAITEAENEFDAEGPRAPGMRREVHQATGMILAQLDVSATEAFALLRAHAFATSRTVDEVARLVVQRDLDFRDLEA